MCRVLTISIVFVFYAFACGWGTIINIPADYPTIQLGINASVNGDTVLVQPDTYYENINFNGQNIMLGSLFLTTGDSLYIAATIIDGGQSGSVVTFNNGESDLAVLYGLTIRNGLAYRGGGIFCVGSSPFITHNIITNNRATYAGGGIECNSNSNASIINNSIINNHSDTYVGGVCCNIGSEPLIDNNLISDNTTVLDAGGIGCDIGSNPTISNNSIIGNSASIGGGIACRASSNPIITENTINGNTAGLHAGGIVCIIGSDPEIINNTIRIISQV